MLSINVEVDRGEIKKLEDAFRGYGEKLGNSPRVAIRRGTINLVKSLRALTLRAKDKVPLSAVTRYKGPGPHYITPKGKKQKAVPRWVITRRGGQDTKEYIHPAATRAEARERFGAIKQWGLAKKSWGLFMTHLFNRANPENKNPKAKIRSGMTYGYLREKKSGGNTSVEALLVNKLGYIRDAMPGNAVGEAVRKATNSINTQINKGIIDATNKL